jgi:hypothetical protein
VAAMPRTPVIQRSISSAAPCTARRHAGRARSAGQRDVARRQRAAVGDVVQRDAEPRGRDARLHHGERAEGAGEVVADAASRERGRVGGATGEHRHPVPEVEIALEDRAHRVAVGAAHREHGDARPDARVVGEAHRHAGRRGVAAGGRLRVDGAGGEDGEEARQRRARRRGAWPGRPRAGTRQEGTREGEDARRVAGPAISGSRAGRS